MEFIQIIIDIVTGEATLQTYLAAFLVILGAVAVRTGYKFLNEVQDAVEKYKDAKAADSPGGTDITPDEAADIEAELKAAVIAAYDRYKGTLLDWLGNLAKKLNVFRFFQ